ncbi:hypothetical protein [Paenibacillus sp. MMS18-CY102]|uniref:hypothetical protein n=1 Tax=Paenibacillus sp. MMS18-CY102 TaxID=2682849 RepID=UPI0013659171|nr:hypothetical protein [Paenibacillus sp. MMS18-CY102]MWC30005.1 hypothetical protein [Paenibacillus sp. MMS18-CY102]
MTSKREATLVSLMNTLWYFWAFYLFMYLPGPRYGYGKDFYATLFLVGLLLFIPFTLFLIVYYVIFFITSTKVKWKPRVYALLLGALIPLLLGSIHRYWWNEFPPMSEKKAGQYADKLMGDRLNHYEYERVIRWDKKRHAMVVIYMRPGTFNCETYYIRRLNTIGTGSSCTDVFASLQE